MKGFINNHLKRIVAFALALFIVLSDSTNATPFISNVDIPDKMNFEQYITKMYDLDESDAKYIEKLENAVYDYKNRYTMYVDHDYVIGKVNKQQTNITYYQPGVQDPIPEDPGPEPGPADDPLGPDNPTPVTPVDPVDPVSPGSPVTPPCGEWYNDASGMATDGVGKELYGGIKYYTGLPWAPTAGTYFFDTDVSTEDAYNWVNSQGGGSLAKSADWAKTANGRICKGVGYTVPKYLRGSGWYAKEGAYVSMIDQVECIGVAVPPCVVCPEYNDGFKPGMWQTKSSAPAEYYNYGHKKMCIVLEGGGGTIYVPCTNADAKGHTFPGGVFQTNVQAGGVSGNIYSVHVASTTGDAGGGAQQWPGNEIASKMNTVNSAGAPPVNYTYNVCEAYCWSPTLLKTLQQGFRVIGYVVWP